MSTLLDLLLAEDGRELLRPRRSREEVHLAVGQMYEQLQRKRPTIILCDTPWEWSRAVEGARETQKGRAGLSQEIWRRVQEIRHADPPEAVPAAAHFERARACREQLDGAVEKESQKRGQAWQAPDQHPHWYDAVWLEREKAPAGLDQAVKGGLLYGAAYEETFVGCMVPQEVRRNAAGQWHAEEGPALRWEGGALYYWHGVPVPEQLIENPETVTRAEVMQERNAEVRRCYQERLGAERFSELFDLQEVDADTDLQGRRQQLLRTAHVDDIAGEPLQFARVTCPTTQRIYYLCVPPHLENVWAAVAWTFGKEAAAYRPEKET